jgi:hypothetical protein
MTATEPSHYRAFRITLAAVVLVALLAAAWWMVQPGMLRLIYGFLGLRVR